MTERKNVPGSTRDQGRPDRLAQALRANLKRRKAQARGQAGSEPRPDRTDGEKPDEFKEKER